MTRSAQPVYIIAEMACSHEGEVTHATTIIDGAGRAGADAIQFQVWQAKDMVVPHHEAMPTLQRIELSREQWTELADHVRKNYPQMDIIACVYERASVDFCETLGVDAYKIHTADLSNRHLVDYVAATGKRIDLSVGASTLDEIHAAVQWIGEASDSAIWMMYGYQNFPTPTDAIHLDYMMRLRDLFGVPIGYQDHSDANTEAAFWLPAAAAGMGVDVLEKHITHDRSFKGVDHEAALNPDEFSQFVTMVREIEAAKGSPVPRPFSTEEIKYRKYSKKSIVASRELAAGETLQETDLLFMRANDLGLPPDRAGELIGRVTRHAIAPYQLIGQEDVE